LASRTSSKLRSFKESKLPKLDDVSWHIEAAGEPEDTAEVRSAVHIGLFVAWAVHRGSRKGFPGPEPDPVELILTRQVTGTRFLLDHCDGKLFTAMLEEDAARYYEKNFTRAYAAVLNDLELTEYRVPDTWQIFDAVAPGIEAAFVATPQRPWWRPW
jgi:hypothetical protein